ncbi:pyocin knob domain-containing protein (plasmid) [Fructilactobacillus ixorae]|uniref:Pyocin knob domain-containing protein n=1 Tax=Fructilactobacillus ixorae TaxID=1750535 RepID=A0ABY5C631_9LACO|nr:pyocin knob domain-containing protein [Fructilactobacillus ixorae]USS94017.1 pyocin knob domain-containing protein [Fructilactobacillus ixorae]
MTKLNIVPVTRPKADNTNEREQVFPITDIKAVRGLSQFVDGVNKSIKAITGKGIRSNADLVTKADLAKFATKQEVEQAKTDAKDYADELIKHIKTIDVTKMDDGTDANDLTKFGFHVKTQNENVKNIPPYGTINKNGVLIVIPTPTLIYQRWVSFDLPKYEYSRVADIETSLKWFAWAYVS